MKGPSPEVGTDEIPIRPEVGVSLRGKGGKRELREANSTGQDRPDGGACRALHNPWHGCVDAPPSWAAPCVTRPQDSGQQGAAAARGPGVGSGAPGAPSSH